MIDVKEKIRRLENRNDKLVKKNKTLEMEMVQRGIEITKIIRIFLMIEHLLPEGAKEEFRKIAIEYSTRNDNGRGKCYCHGQIDFRESMHFKTE